MFKMSYFDIYFVISLWLIYALKVSH